MRWVHQYFPEIEKKIRRRLRPTNTSWKVDETYIKVKGKWKYFYREVDSDGDTIDFMLSTKGNRINSMESSRNTVVYPKNYCIFDVFSMNLPQLDPYLNNEAIPKPIFF